MSLRVLDCTVAFMTDLLQWCVRVGKSARGCPIGRPPENSSSGTRGKCTTGQPPVDCRYTPRDNTHHAGPSAGEVGFKPAWAPGPAEGRPRADRLRGDRAVLCAWISGRLAGSDHRACRGDEDDVLQAFRGKGRPH